MWLKKLTLKNFQKHENLTIDFTPGVNILYGHSDAGKSCIFRAIGFVFFGDPRDDKTIRREGSKQTSVAALLDNGNEVERVKSASVNRYIVRIPGQQELVYDSIGAEIPEEVQQVLQVKLVDIDQNSLNLNLAEQITMPFLTDLPGSSRLKLFNKLTGNDLLDKVAGNFNKEILNINKEIKNVTYTIETNKPKVESLSNEIERRQKLSQSFEASRLKIEKRFEVYKKLKTLSDNIAKNRVSFKICTNELDSIKLVDFAAIASLKSQIQALRTLEKIKTAYLITTSQLDLVKKELAQAKEVTIDSTTLRGHIERLNALNTLHKAYLDTKVGLEAVQAQLSDIKLSELDGSAIRGKIEKIRRLAIIGKALADNGAIIKQSFGEWNTLQMTIPAQEAEYKAILKEAGVCPVCKQDTSKCEAICNSTEKTKT